VLSFPSSWPVISFAFRRHYKNIGTGYNKQEETDGNDQGEKCEEIFLVHKHAKKTKSTTGENQPAITTHHLSLSF